MISSIRNIIKNFTAFDSVVLGLIMFALAWANDFLRGITFCRLFIPVAFVFIISGCFKMQLKLPNVHISYKLLYIFYWILLLIMIIRGILAPYSYWAAPQKAIYDILFNGTFLLGYIMPVSLLIPLHHINFNFLKKANILLGIVFIVMFAMSFNQIRNAAFAAQFEGGDNWESPATFINTIYGTVLFVFLIPAFISKKQFLLNVLCISCCLFSYIIAARRGGVLSYGCYFLIALFFFFKIHKSGLIILSLALPLLLFLPQVQNLLSDFSLLFDYIQERGLENTRSVIDDELLAQMDSFDMIFGKGLLGRYKMQYDIVSDGKGYRYYTETGFYYLVLRGGYLFAFTHILLILIPAINGLIRAKNDLVRVWSIFMLWSLAELYPFGWPTFGIGFFIIWLGCAVCMNDRMVALNNKQINLLFFSRRISYMYRLKKTILKT